MRWWPLLEVLIHESDSAERLVGVFADGVCDGLAVAFSEWFRGQGVEVGKRRRKAEKNLGRAFDDQSVGAILQLDDGSHALLTRVEREHVRDLRSVPGFGERD